MPGTPQPSRVVGGEHPGVYIATETRERVSDHRVEGGTLTWLDLSGRMQRSFSFDDDVTFHGVKYGPPWAIEHFALSEDDGPRRIAIVAHHHVWSPSLVTVLDDRWHRTGTFAHFGWIESVHWVAPDRLLVGGFSNVHDGGMIALLDASALRGQGPEPPGSEGHCESCGEGLPLRIVVMPRTELNRATASRFNRAMVQVTGDRVLVRTAEVPLSGVDTVDAIYEFTPSLQLLRASFSERYWEIHRSLEIQGRLRQTREQSPDRDGPREIQVWEPETGWRTKTIR